jgi:hypothetical protein
MSPALINASTVQNGQGSTPPTMNVSGMGDTQSQADMGDMPMVNRKLSATEQKQLFTEKDSFQKSQLAQKNLTDALDLLQNGDENGVKPYTGMGAMTLSQAQSIPLIGDMLGDKARGAVTMQYNNLIQQQALNNFRAIFGARPAQAELSFLTRLQALPNYTPEEQAKIINEGIDMAQSHKDQSKTNMNSIISGNYANMVSNLENALPSRQQGQKAPGSAPSASPKGIRVQGPNGESGTIDASELQDALKNGWKQVQ